jgi:hypothetical protein
MIGAEKRSLCILTVELSVGITGSVTWLMVRRRSTVRFRKGALVRIRIRTAEQRAGAIPGAKRTPDRRAVPD